MKVSIRAIFIGLPFGADDPGRCRRATDRITVASLAVSARIWQRVAPAGQDVNAIHLFHASFRLPAVIPKNASRMLRPGVPHALPAITVPVTATLADRRYGIAAEKPGGRNLVDPDHCRLSRRAFAALVPHVGRNSAQRAFRQIDAPWRITLSLIRPTMLTRFHARRVAPRSNGLRFGRILPKRFDRLAWRRSRRHARRRPSEASATQARQRRREARMKRITRRSILAAAPAVVALPAVPARAAKNYGPGVTDTEIKIGNTAPYSGPASS
jgi:hypothetical protein